MTEQNFPEKTCSIDRLVQHARLVVAALAGEKTQQRRAGVYGYPGETFSLEGQEFVISNLRQQRLDAMTEQEAQLEGYPSMEAYRDLIIRMHGNMEWDGSMEVWVHEFNKVG